MKDILKVMRFDFLTVKQVALVEIIFVALLFSVLSLLFSPIIASYITFGAATFVIPLQGIADKSDFNKLYGILPVERKSITRARFLYIWLVNFVAEILELLVAVIAKTLKLYRFLPNQDSEMMASVKDSFADTKLTLLTIFGIFTLFCLLFSYMEMMGQIKGRENEFKIIMITVGVLALLTFAFTILYGHDMIPVVSLPSLPESTGGMLILGAVLDVVMLGICILFGEITTNKLIRREL